MKAKETGQTEEGTVKNCPGCGCSLSLEKVISSPEIQIIGMNVDDNEPALNFYYFVHTANGCGTTFGIPVDAFQCLLPESPPARSKLGQPDCEHRCLRIEDRSECRETCRWAPYRRFMLRLSAGKNRKNGGGPQART